ncbi:ABC transporter ATP-binding protein [Paenibacillus lautus]|uniref:ABC transporter ATP-binding protein n=1 Tax=Paenibacillus lautus TaxID=1401 RepID=UPI002DBDFD5B|nr:ABC transporter ATP-binding protein [Paenibacillus lautus]MEC0307105.1 ABC transporter ATP-binding protein [Paenibacillus lautus]
MLETVELRKVFKGKTAVEEVSLYLNRGESVGLIGPNGAGYEELTSYENLKFFGRVYGLNGKELEIKIQELLETVGLRDRQKELIRTYSGGMKRRINIAAALLHDPQIVIMDEPTVGIDPQSRNHILETVRRLNRDNGTTVLYTSHYMEEVEQLCSRMYIMDHGRIIASGTKEELQHILSGEDTLIIQLNRPNPELAEELRSIESVRQVEEMDHGLKLIVMKNSYILSGIVQIAERLGVQIQNIHIQSPSLEDVFLHLTGRKLRD